MPLSRGNINKKQGMVAVLAAVVLSVIMILFMSLINRVRMESSFTSRIGLNEAIYQCASSIGRFAAAKITKDFEYRNLPGGLQLVKNMQEAKTAPIEVTSTIENYAAIQHMLQRIREETKEDVKVKEVLVSLENMKPIEEGIAGPNSQAFANEKTGNIIVTVVFSIGNGFKKSYKIVKDFKYVSLVPHPYSRFTLLLKDFINGSSTTDEKVNKAIVSDGGVADKGYAPLLCVNSLITSVEDLDSKSAISNTSGEVIDGDLENVVKSGWIYLGDNPGTEFRVSDSGSPVRAAAFNIVPAHGKSIPEASPHMPPNFEYGESFHFFYDAESRGWLKDRAWTKWLTDKGLDSIASIVCFKYGFFKNLPDYQIACRVAAGSPPKSINLFSGGIDIYRYQPYPGGDKSPTLRTDGTSYTSAILPFGNTAVCTPTLIFGPILRRYFTVYALHCDNRILPLFSVGRGDGAGMRTSELIAAMTTHMQRWLTPHNQQKLHEAFEETFEWYQDPWGEWPKIYDTTDNLPPIQPQINHTESYMYALKNICAPKEPDKDFATAVFGYKGADKIYPFIADREPVANELKNIPVFNDFDFSASSVNNYINYSGKMSELASEIDNIDFGKRISYEIDATSENKPFRLHQSYFFQKHFFIREAQIPIFQQIMTDKLSSLTKIFALLEGIFSPSPQIVSELSLNKVVKVNLRPGQTFIIDQPLFVRTGGIIDCGNADIEIRAPIINEEISIDISDITPPEARTLPKFPYLTLIGKNIKIVLDSPDLEVRKAWAATAEGDSVKKRPYALPQLHAILISKGKISLEGATESSKFKGINIVGSVIAKDFETAPGKTILGTNSIIEWGFDRSFGKFSKLESGKPFLTSDYYGLTLGPRTHEVFSPE